jgi:hypothetical protein
MTNLPRLGLLDRWTHLICTLCGFSSAASQRVSGRDEGSVRWEWLGSATSGLDCSLFSALASRRFLPDNCHGMIGERCCLSHRLYVQSLDCM